MTDPIIRVHSAGSSSSFTSSAVVCFAFLAQAMQQVPDYARESKGSDGTPPSPLSDPPGSLPRPSNEERTNTPGRDPCC